MQTRARATASFLLSALLPAHAQQAAERVERIEVTGSRIVSLDVESASPIAVIRAEELQLDGFPFLELTLNSFPQLVADQGNRIANGATGTATLDLRGLGAQRTLVLVNGRRLPSGSPISLPPDINQIPASLVARVEILTGGASAIYGSDAIAGVVNFILKDRFEGVQGEIAHDFYNHRQQNAGMAELVRARNFDLPGDKSRDGATTSASLTLGGNFGSGKGNAAVFMRYAKAQALLQSERDYSACVLELSEDRRSLACGGSRTSYPGQFWDIGRLPARQFWTVADSAGGVRTWSPTSDLYNFAPLNHYQRPVERYGAHANANYDLSAAHRLYTEFGYHDDHSVGQIGPSGIFGAFVRVRFENPLLSEDWRRLLVFRNPVDRSVATGPGTVASLVINRRNVEGGAREADLRHTSFREVVGIKGPIGSQWDYDVFAQMSTVVYQQRYSHDFSNVRTLRALDVVVDPATGAPVCRSVIDGSDPYCVPYDIWRLGGVSAAALDYLETPGLQNGSTTQRVVGAALTGDLGKYGIRFPAARQAVELAVGIEHRTEKLNLETDTAFATGDLAGQTVATPSVSGSVTIKEIFGEARVPVIEPVKVSGSYRRSGYTPGKSVHAYGLGFNAEPIRVARLRGSYQRAIRAASLVELFLPRSPRFYLLPGDPCAGETPVRSFADCQRTGVSASSYGRIPDTPFGVYPATAGGNPGLDAERATTYTLGLVLLPISDFSATVDYFDIRLDDTISVLNDGAVIFRLCLDTGLPKFCSRITRDPTLGTLWLAGADVLAIAQNIGRTRVTGADISLTYRVRLPRGHAVNFDGTGTRLTSWTQQPYPGALAQECAGYFGLVNCFRPLPKWRHRARVGWQTPWPFELAGTWRYVGSVKNADANAGAAVLPRLKAMSYVDLAGSWRFHKYLALRAGINNVLDRDPPLVFSAAGAVNGNSYAQGYDVLGRHVFVSMTASF